MTDSRPAEAVATTELLGVKAGELTDVLRGKNFTSIKRLRGTTRTRPVAGSFIQNVWVVRFLYITVNTADSQQSAVLCFPLSGLSETRTRSPTPIGFHFLRWLYRPACRSCFCMALSYGHGFLKVFSQGLHILVIASDFRISKNVLKKHADGEAWQSPIHQIKRDMTCGLLECAVVYKGKRLELFQPILLCIRRFPAFC